MMNGRRLDIDIQSHAEFMARIADMDFAVNAYCMFLNREWFHGSGDRWAVSWREAGGIVADWRGVGESYIDFYMSDFFSPASVNVDCQLAIAGMFGEAGWMEMTPRKELEYREAALLVIEQRENQPTVGTPDWYGRFSAVEARGHDGARDRLHALARRGLVSQEEFLSLFRDVRLSDGAKDLAQQAN
jgi:hypothetical protein